jgi:hypothetical protein
MEGERMDQKYLIQLMEQWHHTDPALYKANIKRLCDDKDIKPRHIESALNVPNSAAKSYVSIKHLARIEFLTALKLAEMLEVKVENFLENI